MFACITIERSVLRRSLVGEVFGAFRAFFDDERKSRIKAWRLIRRSARSLLPAVRAVDGGFSASVVASIWKIFCAIGVLVPANAGVPRILVVPYDRFRKKLRSSLKAGSAGQAYFAPL